MEEKLICCCGSSGWTRVIAWFHIIGAVFASIYYTIAVVEEIDRLSVNRNYFQRQPDVTSLTLPEFQPYQQVRARRTSVAHAVLMLLFALLVFGMGIVLLRGSNNRNPRQIHYWIVYTVICTLVWVVKEIFEIFWLPKMYDDREFAVFGIVVISAIQVFSLWVVHTHKKEIEESTVPPFPVKIYVSKKGEP